jgi:DNA-binding NarL/FixJ family response regulator
MDVSLPDGNGMQATQAILTERPDTKIVFLTIHEDDEQLFAALRAGGLGYLFKNVRAADLIRTLHGVARGEAGLSRAIARRILDEFSRTPAPRPAASEAALELTAREIEVVRELARGATNREIAKSFVISENTVKNHVRNVLAKLHLHSRREIARYARDHNLLPPQPDPPH